jgi:hypothetical protein
MATAAAVGTSWFATTVLGHTVVVADGGIAHHGRGWGGRRADADGEDDYDHTILATSLSFVTLW